MPTQCGKSSDWSWWENLQLMQVAPSCGQFFNSCKWCHLVAKFGTNASVEDEMDLSQVTWLKLHEVNQRWLHSRPPSPSWRVGRQVHRGGAEVYLSSPRVNIAVESTLIHRVQLQCNVDELGGKYTEAKPRCTCPPHESTLQRSLWWITECNSRANLTSRKASTPRRSRGVLAFPTSKICTKSVKFNTNYSWT